MSAVLRPGIRLQAMRESDLDEVLEIERGVYEFPWTWGNFSDSLRAGYSCWTYRQSGVLVGYCILMVAAGEAHLLNLSIGPHFQCRGHGRQLLEHALDVARSQAAQLLFLEVRPTNPAARRLYEASGFRQIGIRRDYYPASKGREDALVLAIDLDGNPAAGQA